MNDQALATAKYASSKMADRRTRILEAARQYVAEVGYDSVTTRGLAERAAVSPATLFNIYGSKEGVIAASVEDHLAGFLGGDGPPLTSIGQLIDSVKRMPKEILRIPHYSDAMVAIYFLPERDNPVRDTLRSTAQSKQSDLFYALKKTGQLAPWADPVEISDQLTNGLFAVIHDWSIGRISARALERDQVKWKPVNRPIARPTVNPEHDHESKINDHALGKRLLSTTLVILTATTQGAAAKEVAQAVEKSL